VSCWRVVSGEHRDVLGEGVIWSRRRNSILWVDIFGQKLQELSMTSGTIRQWPLPERAGWVVEHINGSLLVGLKSGVAALSLDPFCLSLLCSPEPDRPQNRLNDAAVDPEGNLWFGTKDDTDQEASGALYRLDSQLRLTRQDDGYRVPNGPVFSQDGRTAWHSDSLRRIVYAYDITEERNAANRRPFVEFPQSWGFPDGMALDVEGCLWIAHWGGGRVSRLTPNGKVDRTLDLPASNITNVAFAGDDLKRMFVTSAKSDMPDERYAGALFEVEPDVGGFEPVPFGD
jgi:sugar lactone lactonase YvrE